MSEQFKPLLARLADGATLSEADAELFFGACLRGEAGAAQVAAAVTAMRLRGETVGEIAACARALRRSVTPLTPPFEVIDTCGTGGDGAHTLNISTAAALVAAGGGLKVAKHGNRALSSRSGSSDVLAALGCNLDATPAQALRALDEAGVCFLFAPAHNGAMRHVNPIRSELGFRTVFNLLGPLANPAGAKRQVLGVYDLRLVEPLARVLGALGSTRAWVAHGSGLDELTTTGPTDIAEWRADADGGQGSDGRGGDGQGGVRLFRITPEAVGLPRAQPSALAGGEPADNARALRRLLEGERSAYRDIVLLNAAAAFLVAEAEETLEAGLVRAARAIDDGRALFALERLVAISREAT